MTAAAVVSVLLLSAAPAGKSVLRPAATYELAVYWVGKAPSKAELQKLVTDKSITLVAADMKQYAPPDPDMLQYFGRGMSATQIAEVQNATAATRFVVLAIADQRFEAYRAALTAVGAAAKKWKGYAWDEATRELFTPEEWQKRRITEGWADGKPRVAKHIVTHFYANEPNGHRLVSLGMQKFALPDLSVDGAAVTYGEQLMALTNLVAAKLLEKPELGPGGELALEVEKPVQLRLAPAPAQDGDAPNDLYTFVFPGKGALTTRMGATLKEAFGHVDEPILAKDGDQALNAARDRARAKLPLVKKRFPGLKASLESLMVKAPFGEQREWMWVEVQRWQGDSLVGMLVNEPAYVPKLARGDIVTVKEADLFDWMINLRDGGTEGGETNKILERMQR